jgi:hypothetical protein
VSRVTIQSGRLITHYEPHDLPGASIRVEFQCYDEASRPAVGNYYGPGMVTDDRRVILGDPHRSGTLHELTVNTQPHPDSDLYDEGFRAGWQGRRAYTAWSAHKLDGWRDGREQRRAATASAGPSPTGRPTAE